LRWDWFFSEYFGLSLSQPPHQWSVPIFNLILLLAEGQADEVLKASNIIVLFQMSGRIEKCFDVVFQLENVRIRLKRNKDGD
jgi:hypothetical protein